MMSVMLLPAVYQYTNKNMHGKSKLNPPKLVVTITLSQLLTLSTSFSMITFGKAHGVFPLDRLIQKYY
jgi:hypothetical protein